MQPESASDQPPASPTPRRITVEQLAEAVSADTGIPPGRVRRVLLSAERLKPSLEQGSATPATAEPAASDTTGGLPPNDPLRWYPVGANGRLRSSPPPGLEP